MQLKKIGLKVLTRFFFYTSIGIVFLTLINFIFNLISINPLEAISNNLDSFILTFTVNTLISIFVIYLGFIVSIYLFDDLNKNILKYFISFPHISFAIGILFFFSSSGFLQRILSIFKDSEIPINNYLENFEYSILYILSLTIRELPFIILLGITALNKIKFQKILINSKNLKINNFVTYSLLVFPIWIKKMYLPIIIVISFTYSNLEYSLILGTQFPELLNQVLIEKWYEDYHYQDFKIYQVTFCIIIAFILNIFCIYSLVKTKKYIIWKFQKSIPDLNLALIGKISYKVITFTFIVNFFILFIFSVSNNWYFPDLIPKNFIIQNYNEIIKLNFHKLVFSICLSLILSCIVLFFSLHYFLNKQNYYDKILGKILFMSIILLLIIPQNIFLISFNSLINYFEINNIFVPYSISLYLFIIPYTFYILKETFETKLFEKLIIAEKNLKLNSFKFFLSIIYPIYKKVIWFCLIIGFTVCYYQFIQSIIIGNGKYSLFNNEVLVLFSGGSMSIASAGAVINLIPCLILFIFFRGNDVKL